MPTVYTKDVIENLFDGYWYREPTSKWFIETVTISKTDVNRERKRKKLFIAIDSDTWHLGSGNQGIYAGWTDTHTIVTTFQHKIDGVIAQKPIPSLDENIPQFITENTYEVIQILGNYAYEKFTGKMIAITGTAGKSTSKNLLNHILTNFDSVIATRGNHNTRTGVPLTIACAVSNPNYLVVESAVSGLWMKQGGILKNYPPNVALITSIDGGQAKTAYETAKLKARVAEGMNNEGTVIINKETKEFDVLKESVERYNENILTYGIDDTCDSFLIDYKELRSEAKVHVQILGEKVTFTTYLLGKAMVQNIIGVLTVLKHWNFPLQEVIPFVETYKPAEGIQTFEQISLPNGKQCTMLDDSWNATGIAMIETINLFGRQAPYYSGKKIAILGRIEYLGDAEAKRQHEALVDPILQAGIDLVFAHGPEMKYLLKKLPETIIGGYFENSKLLSEAVAPLIKEDDFLLVKGSPRSSDFKFVKKHLLTSLHEKKGNLLYSIDHPYATASGAMTFELESNVVVGMSGNPQATQNHGVGHLLLLQIIMEKLFAKELVVNERYKPGRQALKETTSTNAVPLVEGEEIALGDILSTAIIQYAPNTLLMLANQVIGNNNKAMAMIQEKGKHLSISQAAIGNVTGRRITNKKQRMTLLDLYKAAKVLFDGYSTTLNWFAQNICFYRKEVYEAKTNLFHKGIISHGIFYGHLHSIGAVLTQNNGKKYVTVVLGAKDMYDRDRLIQASLDSMKKKKYDTPVVADQTEKTPYKINMIGDTYFGEFYTRIRKRQGRLDGLQKYGRAYSFDRIRPLIEEGDFNICNFEAALSESDDYFLRRRKPFVLLAHVHKTVPAMKQEKFDLVTLANNHLMDGGKDNLVETIEQFKGANIATVGAGNTQEEAEKPFVKIVNGKRFVIFNAYWHRNSMYVDFDFYALGPNPGVANMSGSLFEQIRFEKKNHPESFIIVIPHWGGDFKTVSKKQRQYAHSLVEAGADVIIGHGAHMIQEIEKVHDTYVVYSIGNGVFNSDGEYNRRHVAPYSLFVQLIYEDNRFELRLYPIYTNNLKTFWQPKFADRKQFEHCTYILKSFQSTQLTKKQDEQERYYYVLDL